MARPRFIEPATPDNRIIYPASGDARPIIANGDHDALPIVARMDRDTPPRITRRILDDRAQNFGQIRTANGCLDAFVGNDVEYQCRPGIGAFDHTDHIVHG